MLVGMMHPLNTDFIVGRCEHVKNSSGMVEWQEASGQGKFFGHLQCVRASCTICGPVVK